MAPRGDVGGKAGEGGGRQGREDEGEAEVLDGVAVLGDEGVGVDVERSERVREMAELREGGMTGEGDDLNERGRVFESAHARWSKDARRKRNMRRTILVGQSLLPSFAAASFFPRSSR